MYFVHGAQKQNKVTRRRNLSQTCPFKSRLMRA